MTKPSPNSPIIERFYGAYLRDENTAAFIKAVAQRYTCATLERIVRHGPHEARRAAVLALGFLGGYESNAALGRALRDEDRGVRMLAENGIRDLWRRDGNDVQRQQLSVIMGLNASEQFEEVIRRADELLKSAPWFAEVWNQRAVACFQLGRYKQSAHDCHQTLEINPYHFPAAVGMANCHLELNDAVMALESFQRALRLNPNMEDVRAQVQHLQRTLEEK